jgi:thiol-disulfide isomerase/thioredoxin
MIERGWRVAAVALAVIAGVWAGARLHSAAPTPGSDKAGVAIPVGEASPPTASDFADEPSTPGILPEAVHIPDRLPDFALQDLDGKRTSIEHWAGKSLVINFWATWCAPCRREIPMLEALSGEWAGRGIAVIGIAVDHRDQVVRYAKELGIPYPLLTGEQDALDVAEAMGVQSPVFPFTVFTDRRGEVVALFVGALSKAQAGLILSVVQGVNRQEMALPEARRSISDGLRALSDKPPGTKPG